MLCLLAFAPRAAARSYRSTNDRAQHFLHLSIGGGEANTCLKSGDVVDERGMHVVYPIKNAIGGEGIGELSYEIRKHSFLFGVYGSIRYANTGVRADSLLDSYLTMDADPEPAEMIYTYHFNDFSERQLSLSVGGGLRAGFYFLDNMYMALGAKVEKPLSFSYATESQLYTSVMWPFADYPIYSKPGDVYPHYGLYDAAPFEREGEVAAYKSALMVSPTLEIGAHLHIANRFYMRLAGYMEYAIPVGRVSEATTLLDYSAVDRPNEVHNYFFTREELWNNMQAHSALDYAGSSFDKGRLSVGAKVSLMLDVTTHRDKCTTCNDDTGIRFQSRGSRGSGSVWMW